MSTARLVIAGGDPYGCGSLVAVDALARLKIKNFEIFLVSSRRLLLRYPAYHRLSKNVITLDVPFDGGHANGFGPSVEGGRFALACLERALEVVKSERIPRLVTAPVSKEAVQMVEPLFQGHTEFLADHFNVKRVEMMMVSPAAKIVLLTRHVLLAQVPQLLTVSNIVKTLGLVYAALVGQFKIKDPVIALAAFNPHAGVSTYLGKEDKIIQQAVVKFGRNVRGPFPPDTVFLPANLKKVDCVIAAHHDQGMIAFKLLSFKDGVNFTAGLPIIRTSPAHGTAFDLMRKNITPDCSSMLAAIKLALKLEA